MLEVKENVDIRDYCTFKVGGQFRYFVEIYDKSDLSEVCKIAKEKNLPIHVLGGGSNMVFPDGILEVVALKINFSGFEVVNDSNEYTEIKIGSGENWDSVVERTVAMNLSGVEALSAIPGTTGATPVQNVGAYGQETKDTLVEVEVFDIDNQSFTKLSNKDCGFSYRDSIFKREGKGRYIITSVTFRLSKSPAAIPNYPGVKRYFDEKGIVNPSLSEIRESIVSIRSVKLPDPKKVANVGSFFKNAIVPKVDAERLVESYPNMTIFPIDEIHTKVPAGWLIENTGLKGHDFGPISVYANNALVLVNNGSATRADVEQVRDEIVNTVFQKFGITLEAEPEFV